MTKYFFYFLVEEKFGDTKGAIIIRIPRRTDKTNIKIALHRQNNCNVIQYTNNDNCK
jgi:hypothetical protein